MHKLVRTGVIEAAAQLPADVEQIPDRKSFFARQHGRNAVALHVLHGGAELTFDFAGAPNLGDIRAAQNIGALSFCQ
jgi:hypothetical protein